MGMELALHTFNPDIPHAIAFHGGTAQRFFREILWSLIVSALKHSVALTRST
jgi:hypothetical protein